MDWLIDLQEFAYVFYRPVLFVITAFWLVGGLVLAVLSLLRSVKPNS